MLYSDAHHAQSLSIEPEHSPSSSYSKHLKSIEMEDAIELTGTLFEVAVASQVTSVGGR